MAAVIPAFAPVAQDRVAGGDAAAQISSPGWPPADASCAFLHMNDHDRLYDSGTTLCGELALALRAELAALQPGQVLRVVASDAAAPQDLPAWCEVSGHTLLRAEHPNYWIRRKN